MTFWVDVIFLLYFLLLNSTYTLLIFLSIIEIIQRSATRMPEMDSAMLSGAYTPPITVIAPAFNEEATIMGSVSAFLQLEYPNYQVVVVNDGSRDETFERLRERYDLRPINVVVRQDIKTNPIYGVYQSLTDPRLLVVDKANGGKSDALNAGLNVSRTPLVCCVDADSLIDRRALLRMVEPYIQDEENVVAVGGTVRLANGCTIRNGVVTDVKLPRSLLARFQIIEYLRAFLFGRMGFNRFGGNLIISGAFGLFQREAMIEAGGYMQDTVGEDMELVVRIHRHMREKGRNYKIVYIPDPVCYTEAPETIEVLKKQRDRWQRGLADTLWMHSSMLFNPVYGKTGMLVFPIYFFFELFGPVVELAGYFYFLWSALTGAVDLTFCMLFFLLAFLWGFMLSVQSIVLDGMMSSLFKGFGIKAGLLWVALLENFGYRQMTLYFRLLGLFRFLTGNKSWGDMKRKGFDPRQDAGS